MQRPSLAASLTAGQTILFSVVSILGEVVDVIIYACTGFESPVNVHDARCAGAKQPPPKRRLATCTEDMILIPNAHLSLHTPIQPTNVTSCVPVRLAHVSETVSGSCAVLQSWHITSVHTQWKARSQVSGLAAVRARQMSSGVGACLSVPIHGLVLSYGAKKRSDVVAAPLSARDLRSSRHG